MEKTDCCSACVEDKELGYGDDIDGCCCRHNKEEIDPLSIEKIVIKDNGKGGAIKFQSWLDKTK